jgi:CheY-like chemotaxis protein
MRLIQRDPISGKESKLMSSTAAAAALAPVFVETPHSELATRLRAVRRQALVVDDNPDITHMLAAVLRHANYEVSTACSASVALAAALAKHFDVVISDIGMPEMSGYELVRALRSIPGYGTTLMVSMTGFDMYDDRDQSLDAGFNAHLSKPVDQVTLMRVISPEVH